MSVIILTFVVLNQVTHCRLGLINFYGSPVSLEFLFGLALGAIYLELGTLSPLHASLALVLGFAIFAAGIALHVSDGSNRVWYWGTSSACLLVSIVSIETEFGWFDLGILNGLADASYSTILSQFFSLGFANYVINETHVFRFIGETGSQIFLIVSALTIGSLIYTCIERPWVRFVRYLCSVNARALPDRRRLALT